VEKQIILVATLDTKGEPAQYLKECIEAINHPVLLLDINTGGEPTAVPDISAETVAAAGGGDIHEIRASRDTRKVTPIMIRGAIAIVLEMLGDGRFGGIVSFGGASGAIVATSIMKALPFGIPKFMVSSAASMPAYAARFIDTKDITMMHSVIDIDGLNDLSKSVLERAAGGICGMVEASKGPVKPQSDKSLIAITEFRFNGESSRYVQEMLHQKGYEVIPFHAQGVGDRAMDELIDQGVFDGVIDLVPAGISEYLLGGNRSAGEHRLEAAGRRGIPTVVTPAGFDLLSCGPVERNEQGDPLWTSRKLADRKMYIPDRYRVQARTSAEELREIGSVLAQKLNQAKGPVTVLIPTRGWTVLSKKTGPLYEPETDAILAPLLREKLKPEIVTEEINTPIDSPEFAKAAVAALEKMMGGSE
jgi:uncharacterized protein (UPF0261 family)